MNKRIKNKSGNFYFQFSKDKKARERTSFPVPLREEKKAKDEAILASLQIVNEMLQRGYEFLPIRIGKSRAKVYVIEDGKIRLPYMALKGLGESVASAMEEATMNGQSYLSADELQSATGASSTIMDTLMQIGALGDLPKSNQVSFF